MNTAADEKVDFVEELRLRRWARINHVPPDDRDLSWNAIILDEMARRDEEIDDETRNLPFAGIAPIGEQRPKFHSAHDEGTGPRFLASPQRSGELYYT